MLSLIALNRALPFLLKYISPGQSAFIQGRSAADILWTLRWAKAVADKRGHPVYVMEMDIAKAFDTVNRLKLLDIINSLVDKSTFNMIKYLLLHSSFRVKVLGQLSDKSISTTTGIPQGDALSPLLFDAYLECASRNAHIIDKDHLFQISFDVETVMEISYADDYDIIAFKKENALKAKENATASFQSLDLRTNEQKQRLYAISQHHPENLGDDVVCYKDVKKLGSMVDSERDYRHIIGKARLALKVYSRLWNSKYASRDLKLRVYNACIKPILRYNTNSIVLPQSKMNKFNSFHRKQLRQVLGVHFPFIVKNEKLRQITRMETSFTQDIAKSRWRLFRKVLNLPLMKAPPQAIMYCYYTDINHRGRGRRPTSMPEILDKDLQHIGHRLQNEVDLENLRNLARDSSGWNCLEGAVVAGLGRYERMLDYEAKVKAEKVIRVKNPKRRSQWRSNEKGSRKKTRTQEEDPVIEVPRSRGRKRLVHEDEVETENCCHEARNVDHISYNLRPRKATCYRGSTK